MFTKQEKYPLNQLPASAKPEVDQARGCALEAELRAAKTSFSRLNQQPSAGAASGEPAMRHWQLHRRQGYPGAAAL